VHDKIVAVTDAGNHASAKMLNQVGFVPHRFGQSDDEVLHANLLVREHLACKWANLASWTCGLSPTTHGETILPASACRAGLVGRRAFFRTACRAIKPAHDLHRKYIHSSLKMKATEALRR
jgi:hypothetical protein